MAEPSQLTQHIESFVDLSRSPAQQAASRDAVVSLLMNNVITIGLLVRQMEMYLTTSDNVICARDWRALRGVLVGCLALMKRKSGGTVTCSDAKALVGSYLLNLQIQSLGQRDRKFCLELLECLLEDHPDSVASVDGSPLACSLTPLFEPFAMLLLLEKLSSSLPSAKVDSLKYLGCCTSQYGAERVAKHAGALWSSLRDAICNSGDEHALSFTLELLHGVDTQGNQIERQALSLLEKLIIQNNDLFLGLIIHDQEINVIINTATSYRGYKEIPTQRKQKLYAVGRILYVSAKSSVASCNKIFQSFYPHLMTAVGLSVESACGMCCSNGNGIVCGQANFGSLYLCIELLGACAYLIVDPEGPKSQFVYANET